MHDIQAEEMKRFITEIYRILNRRLGKIDDRIIFLNKNEQCSIIRFESPQITEPITVSY